MAGAATAALLPTLPRAVAAADAPKRGGHLVFGIEGAGAGDNLDPATYAGTYMPVVGLQLMNTLTEVDENGKLMPILAESWESRSGAKEWAFKLRRGVSFHNGKTMTAADVAYSLNRHRGKDSKSAAKAYLAVVTELRAAGENELVITLEGGDADFPYVLADTHLGIMPENADPSAGIGTGAFMLEGFEPGVRARTKRFANHFRSDRGYVDSVETLAINDPVARFNALLSGAIHIMSRPDPHTASAIEKNPKLQLFNTTAGGHFCFPMQCDKPPFNNLDVRLALKYAIDREEVVKRVLLGYGKVANDQPIPAYDPNFAADLPQRRYDPDKAKFHMAKSGYSGPIELQVSDGAFAGAVAAAEVFQANAAKAGVTLQVTRVPADGYWKNIWMKVPFCASYWSGRPTADLVFQASYTSQSPWNETNWKVPKFDQTLLAARVEADPAKRRQMFHDLQVMVNEDGGELIPMFNNFLDAASVKVKGYVPMPTFSLGGLRAGERVWLES
jgi:peptide/nickel transport system substrate-binding protein